MNTKCEPKRAAVSSNSVLDYDQILFDDFVSKPPFPLGSRTAHALRGDARHVLFSLARYKFCAKMLEGKEHVLEVGCGDAFGAPLMLQTVHKLHCVDIEPRFIEYGTAHNEWGDRVHFSCIDMIQSPAQGLHDAGFCMDVIEHIPHEKEHDFMRNIHKSLIDDAVFIVGTPNITADAYASEMSRNGHVNLKSKESLLALVKQYFAHVFMFSMNDEVVHTGYAPMAHFLIALCVGKREI